jgi:hypothetical protein
MSKAKAIKSLRRAAEAGGRAANGDLTIFKRRAAARLFRIYWRLSQAPMRRAASRISPSAPA